MDEKNNINLVNNDDREENECFRCGHYPSLCICGCVICRRNAPVKKEPKITFPKKVVETHPENDDGTEQDCNECGHKPRECDCGCNECASNK